MIKIGIVGATGAVGQTFLDLVSRYPERYDVNCYASSKSAGQSIRSNEQFFSLKEFSSEALQQESVAFLCVSGDFSLKYGELLAKNSYVVDNSSAFRYRDDIPLLVPPINGQSYRGQKLIANPNCSSAIALMVLGPIHREYGIEHMVVSTYQAASGAGKAAMEEIKERVVAFKEYDRNKRSEHFIHDLAFNIVPQVDAFQDNGYTREEMKVTWEIRKVLNTPNLKISTTAVRVPTLRSHAESVTLKLQKPVECLDTLRDLLRQAPGVELRDDPAQNIYPMPKSSTYKHNVEVGRIRHNLIYGKEGIDLFISGDQLLRGAALNAFEILQLIEKEMK